MSRSIPVSYTHLDVYKRQALKIIFPRLSTFPRSIKARLLRIDVYKRQLCGCGRIQSAVFAGLGPVQYRGRSSLCSIWPCSQRKSRLCFPASRSVSYQTGRHYDNRSSPRRTVPWRRGCLLYTSICHTNGVYYGQNVISKNMIIADRRQTSSPYGI